MGKSKHLSVKWDLNSHANVSFDFWNWEDRFHVWVLKAARARGARKARVCARAPPTTLQPQPWRTSPSLFLLSLFVGRRKGVPFLFVFFTENKCYFSDTYLYIPPLLIRRQRLFIHRKSTCNQIEWEELTANMTERKDRRLTVRLHIRCFL